MNMTKSLIVHFPDAQSRKAFANHFDFIYWNAEEGKRCDPTNDYWDTFLEAYPKGEITQEFVD